MVFKRWNRGAVRKRAPFARMLDKQGRRFEHPWSKATYTRGLRRFTYRIIPSRFPATIKNTNDKYLTSENQQLLKIIETIVDGMMQHCQYNKLCI